MIAGQGRMKKQIVVTRIDGEAKRIAKLQDENNYLRSEMNWLLRVSETEIKRIKEERDSLTSRLGVATSTIQMLETRCHSRGSFLDCIDCSIKSCAYSLAGMVEEKSEMDPAGIMAYVDKDVSEEPLVDQVKDVDIETSRRLANNLAMAHALSFREARL